MKKYRFFFFTVIAAAILFIFYPQIGPKSFNNAVVQIREMLLVIPPIFLLLGLLDVWVPKTTMVKYMGEGSGLKGMLLAFFIGSAAAGPLYGAFPVAAVFMKKGVKFFNLLVFIGAWSTTKIPMFLFELQALGVKFAVTRLLIDIPGIVMIAFALSKLVPQGQIDEIYRNAENMENE